MGGKIEVPGRKWFFMEDASDGIGTVQGVDFFIGSQYGKIPSKYVDMDYWIHKMTVREFVDLAIYTYVHVNSGYKNYGIIQVADNVELVYGIALHTLSPMIEIYISGYNNTSCFIQLVDHVELVSGKVQHTLTPRIEFSF
jgi:hypothetical protein